jgi:hypothetical protein
VLTNLGYIPLGNEFILGPMAHATLIYVVVELNIKVDLWHHRFHHIKNLNEIIIRQKCGQRIKTL